MTKYDYEFLQRKKEQLIVEIVEFKDYCNYNSEKEEYKNYIYINNNSLSVGTIKSNTYLVNKFGYFYNKDSVLEAINKFGNRILELNRYGLWD